MVDFFQTKFLPRNIKSIFSVSEDCEWANWTPWTPCSRTCGHGFKDKRRVKHVSEKYGGSPCVGPEMETEVCSVIQCSGIMC